MAVLTLLLAVAASQVRIDAAFLKLLPLGHPYVKAFFEEQALSAGGNQVFIALEREDGDIFDAHFLDLVRQVTKDVANIPGVDRTRVTSLFTPNVTYTELVEAGFVQDKVVPANFSGTPEEVSQVRRNVGRSGLAARLVSADRKGTMITAELVEVDPATHKKTDYIEVAHRLESDVRAKHQSKEVQVHLLGFAKLIGEIFDGLWVVLLFVGLTLSVSFVLLWLASRSVLFALLPILAGILSVTWQVGAVTLLGMGIDPLSVLICFLTFAVATSHSVQITEGIRRELVAGSDWATAAERTVRSLWLPATLSCGTDFIGYGALLFIPIGILHDVAWSAILGEAALLLIVLLGLPCAVSYLSQKHAPGAPRHASGAGARIADATIRGLSQFAGRRAGAVAILCAAILAGVSLWVGEPEVGDLQPGAPELHQSSLYNQDVAEVSRRFAMGTDVLTVFIKGPPDACLNYEAMERIDRLDFNLRQVAGVQGVVDLPRVAKTSFVSWNEGNPRWYGLPGTQEALSLSVTGLEPSTGLLNHDCSKMTMVVFTQDHMAPTLRRVTQAVQAFIQEVGTRPITFRLGGGNVGLMAAVNETLGAAQVRMRTGVFGCIILLVLLWLRSWRAVLIIVGPLAVVAMMTNALMTKLGIGLTVATAPVFALGAGLGVDFSIYVFSRLDTSLRRGQALVSAYQEMLHATGRAVLLTGLTLATSIGVWAFSPLKLQSEMGLLLALILGANVIGALVLLPALAAFLLRPPGSTRQT
jgi:predicted RND superfamily exporter protein